MRTSPIVATLAAGVLAACGRESAPPPSFTSHDSAGIHVVASTSPALRDGAWRVDTTPTVRIGQAAGPPEYQLYRVGPIARLSDGAIVVAVATELRFFAAHGRWVRTVGRRGGGPGEYQAIQLVRRLQGDSLLVWDQRSRRATILAPDGSFVRDSVVSSGQGSPPKAVAALDDGRLVFASAVARFPTASTPYWREGLDYTLQAAVSDSPRIPLARLRGTEMQVSVGQPQGNFTTVSLTPLPFSRDAFAAAGPGHVYLGDSDRYHVRVFAADGTPAIILRVTGDPRPVTDALLDSLGDYRHHLGEVRRAELAGAGRRNRAPSRPARWYRDQVRSYTRVPTAPAFSALIADDAGHLWIRRYDTPWRESVASARWDVFDADGRLLARVTTPVGFAVRCIAGNLVLGVVTDDLGVEYVQGLPVSQALDRAG